MSVFTFIETQSVTSPPKASGLPMPTMPKSGGLSNGSGGGIPRSNISASSIPLNGDNSSPISIIPSRASISSVASSSSNSSNSTLPVLSQKNEEWQSNFQAILNAPIPKPQSRRVSTSSLGRLSTGSANSSMTGNLATSNAFALIFTSLSSTELSVAIEALENMLTALRPEHFEKYRPYLETRVDQLVILCNKQYRIYLNQHYPGAVNSGDPERIMNAEKLYRCISSVINRVFSLPLGKLVSRDVLRELFTHILPFLVEFKNNELIANAVTHITSAIIKGSDSTNLLSALIRMLHDYVRHDSDPEQNKFLEMTMKFLWRISKAIKIYMETLNIDVVLLETHIFFSAYPRKIFLSDCFSLLLTFIYF